MTKESPHENPPAFPACEQKPDGKLYIQKGMSLRDYFAAAALPGLITILTGVEATRAHASPESERRILAKSAYLVADEMLKARIAKGEGE